MAKILAAAGVLILVAATGCSGTTPTASSQKRSTPPASTVSARATEPTHSASPSTTPTVVHRKVTVTRRIPYTTKRVKDPSLTRGHTRVRRSGSAGVRKLTYVVSYTNGERTGRRLVRKTVTRRPTAKVIAVGTKEHRNCDPNYSGACVPIASDVDCAGGSGNGPAYVRGPVRVTGTDHYDLDRDGDGIACD